MLSLGLFDLLVPVIVLIIVIIYLPITLFLLLKDRKFSHLKSWTAFRQAWFARFWIFFGQASKPLFADDVEPILSRARGVVLDVGTGSGDWIYMFSTARNPNITKLFLLEPNTNFHEGLRESARRAGVHERCEIISGIGELDKHGIRKETIDTITTVHVLCSVSAPGLLIRELYQYLRPGGQWLVYEHVKANEGETVATTFQGE